MTINGSTNNSGWTYKLEVTETATSVQNRTSTVQVKAYLGRANSQSYLGGSYSISVNCAGQSSTQSGTIAYPTYINGGAWLQLKTFTFTVSNTGNPTVIGISSTMNSSDFTPSYASASGNMQLTILHLNPTIETAEMEETNATMIALNVPDTTIVRYLSEKQITLHATATDSATLTYRLEHFGTNYNIPTSGYQASNIFNTNYTTNDFTIDEEFKANILQKIEDSLNGTATDWVRVSIGGVAQKPDAIPYMKPSLVQTATTVKRKSGTYSTILGRVANLTDGIVSINVTGTIYKEDDIIGNNNSVTTIGYKIWQANTSEPANYTTLTASVSDGNVTVTDFEVSNVNFDEVYNYKIILADYYSSNGVDNNYDIVSGIIPLGQALWTEYKDRVDFLGITRQGKNIYSNVYSDTEEIVVGKWIDDKPIYRKVLSGTTGNTAGDLTLTHNISNVDKFINIQGFIDDTDQRFFPNFYRDFDTQYAICVYRANSTNILITYGSSRTNKDFYLILEYTKNN